MNDANRLDCAATSLTHQEETLCKSIWRLHRGARVRQKRRPIQRFSSKTAAQDATTRHSPVPSDERDKHMYAWGMPRPQPVSRDTTTTTHLGSDTFICPSPAGWQRRPSSSCTLQGAIPCTNVSSKNNCRPICSASCTNDDNPGSNVKRRPAVNKLDELTSRSQDPGRQVESSRPSSLSRRLRRVRSASLWASPTSRRSFGRALDISDTTCGCLSCERHRNFQKINYSTRSRVECAQQGWSNQTLAADRNSFHICRRYRAAPVAKLQPTYGTLPLFTSFKERTEDITGAK